METLGVHGQVKFWGIIAIICEVVVLLKFVVHLRNQHDGVQQVMSS